jgi:hypothetical protein
MGSMAGVHGPLIQGSSHGPVTGGTTPGGSGPLDLSSATFAGGAAAGGQIVATQSDSGGNTVVHLQDGSTITVVGVTHFDASFLH